MSRKYQHIELYRESSLQIWENNTRFAFNVTNVEIVKSSGRKIPNTDQTHAHFQYNNRPTYMLWEYPKIDKGPIITHMHQIQGGRWFEVLWSINYLPHKLAISSVGDVRQRGVCLKVRTLFPCEHCWFVRHAVLGPYLLSAEINLRSNNHTYP